MKHTKAAIYLCAALLLAAAPGCGTSGKDTAAPAGTETDNRDSAPDTEKNDSDSYGNPRQNSKDTPSEADMPEDSSSQPGSEPQSGPVGAEETISGEVKSIGDNSIVLNQAEVVSDQEMEIMVGDSPDAKLVTVRFSENTEFVVSTVKNSGINGDSDVESREGSFSDIKEQSSLELTGSYEGEDFVASRVILYIFL